MDVDALYAAALAGDDDAISKLEMEADRVHDWGHTILHNESMKGNTERVRFILREFAHKNLLVKLGDQKETALAWAAYFGHNEVAEVLIDAARHLPPSSASDITHDNPVTSFQAFIRQPDQDRNTALHVAVKEGHVHIAKLLVEADPSDTHIQNNQGKTPMYIAVEKGFDDIVVIIYTTCTAPSLDGPDGSIVVPIKNIDQGKSPGGTLYKIMDRYALYVAAIGGDADAIAKLEMQAGILHAESQNTYADRVRFILREFAKKNLLAKLDDEERTVLHWAAYDGHTEVAEVLIDAARHLPPPSASDITHDNPVTSFQAFLRQADKYSNYTALHRAVMEGHASIVKLLVEADPSDTHIQNDEGKTPMYIAVEKGFNDIVEIISTTCTAPSWDGPEGKTAIYIAAEKGYSDIVKVICTSCTAQIKRNGLMRLIFKAIDNEYSNDIIELLSKAFEAGIDPVHKELALILAIQKLDEGSVLRLLRNAKQLVTFKEDNGWTPLHYAVYHEFDSILGAIIKAQKDVGHSFEYGNMESTPFYVAVNNGCTSTLVRLMELWPASANSPYTVVNDAGQNILHLAAASSSRNEMVQGILKYCPEKYKDEILKKQDIDGNTPLHLLFYHGCFIPELIKHKGLETNAKNKKDFTPRDMLYVEDDIVEDQVHIKIALDDVQTNQSVSKLWSKRTEKKTDIWKCNRTTPSKRKKKDGKFEEGKKILMDEEREQMKKDLETYKNRTNTQILVTALITTVTFTVGFTMPGGLHQSKEDDEGLAVLSGKRAFIVFMVSDVIALLMSTLSLFFYFLESMSKDLRQVSLLNASSTVLNILSIMAMMLTFITGTYVVLSDSKGLAIGVCIIGCLFFLVMIIVCIMKIIYDRRVKKNKY